MSGYNRFTASKSDSRIKSTNVDSGMPWKPKTKIAIDRSSDSIHGCQKDHSSVSGEKSDVKDETSSMQNLKKPTLISVENDDTSMKVKQYQDKPPKDDDNDSADLKSPFDICPKEVNHVKLKTPLHVINKEKRNWNKRSVEGQKFDMLRPGMVLMKRYISCDDQISIVQTCRDLGISDGGFYQPGYSGGTKLHLKMMCLGKNWDPESRKYGEDRAIDKSKPPGIPNKFHDMVKKAIQDSNEHMRENITSRNEGKIIPSMLPDICIVNFYTKTGRLGLHQDKDESEKSLKEGLPVVSFSIGDSAEFLYGDTRDIDEAKKVILESGDILIFGGESRLIYHGVTSIKPNTAPQWLTDMIPGRLNLTFRKY